MAQGTKSTETGGKVYSINLGAAGFDSDMKTKVADTYRMGTSGSPDDQGGVSPFGNESAGGPHIY